MLLRGIAGVEYEQPSIGLYLDHGTTVMSDMQELSARVLWLWRI